MAKEHLQPGTRDIFPTRISLRDLVVINGYLDRNTRAVSVAYYIANDDIGRILENVQHFEDLASQGLLPEDEVKTRILHVHIPLYREPAQLILRAATFVRTGDLNNTILNIYRETADDPHSLSEIAQRQEIFFDEAEARQEKRIAVLEAEDFMLLTKLGGMLEKGRDLEAVDFAADYYITYHMLNNAKAKTVRRGQRRFHQLYDSSERFVISASR